MTLLEVKTLAGIFLQGDNSKAEIDDLIVKSAIYEVATRCEPLKLIKEVDDSANDVFRKLLDDTLYVRKPVIGTDSDELDIDTDLHTAVVFFICAYLSFKNKDYYEKKAEKVISIYKTNNLNVS